MNKIEIKNLVKEFKVNDKEKKNRNLNTNYFRAVDNLSLNVKKGECFGLLGPNGAGKTTTLRVLSTLLKPTSGDILIDGLSVIEEDEKIRGKIAFLTSELKLDDFFTPNYLFNFFSELHNVPLKEREERKQKLFNKFGITEYADVKVRKMSTGMKQKLSIVISLVHDPEIIIFDEPTNGLDILTAKTVIDYLIDLKKEGKTIVISSHIFDVIEKTCDRVAIINKGKVVYENVLSNIPNLEKIFFEKVGEDE